MLACARVTGRAPQYTGDITPAAKALPKWKFAAISIFDSVAGVLVLVSISRVNGSLAILLLQGVVFFTMVGSVLLLGHKYARRAFARFRKGDSRPPPLLAWQVHSVALPRGRRDPGRHRAQHYSHL